MYSEPTGLVFVEFHESTAGTGMVVSRFTLWTVSQAVGDQAHPVSIALTELQCRYFRAYCEASIRNSTSWNSSDNMAAVVKLNREYPVETAFFLLACDNITRTRARSNRNVQERLEIERQITRSSSL